MSKIFVDQVDPKTGTSLTLGTSGDTVNIPSGVTLANAGTMTGVPAPTSGVAASAIDSGTIATARLGSGTASSSTFLRGDQTYAAATAAVTPDNWQYFVISANQTMSANASTTIAGWVDGAITGRLIYNLGTQYVTHSSGTFSFSTEGYYKIAFRVSGSTSGSTDSSGYIFTTTNNSSYGDAVDCNFSKSTGAGFNWYMDTILKVTDTTNQKVRTGIYAASNSITVAGHGGNATRQRTYIRFERLGTTA